MATSRPISTVSYNTEPFLVEKLNGLVKAHIIQAYQYIFHKGEDGDKDHIHLRLEPNKTLDPMDLTELFREYVPDNDKPLGVRPWRSSKEGDWLLYVLHDPDYLRMKYGEDSPKNEKLPYTLEDVRVSEDYDLEVMYIRARQSIKGSAQSVVKSLQEGRTAVSLVNDGINPFTVSSSLKLLQQSEYTAVVQQYDGLLNEYNILKAKYELAVKLLNEQGIDLA